MVPDIRTLILVLGITHLIQVAVFLQQFRTNRVYGGLGWWLLWSVAAAAGFIAMLLRQIPSIHSAAILAQNALLFAGTLFLYVGVLRFLGRSAPRKSIASVFAVFIAAFAHFVWVDDDIVIRSVIISGALTVVSLVTARALLVHKIASIAASARFNAVIFLIHGAVFAQRTVMIAAGTPVDDVFAPNLFNLLPYVDALVVSLLWTFGLIIMVNQRLNAELREAKEHFQAIFQASPDASLITRLADGVIVDVNDGFTALSGYSRDEAIGKSTLEVNVWKHPQDRQRVIDELRATGACNIEAAFVRKDGSETTGIVSSKVVRLRDVPHIISVTRDIGERKQHEMLIEEQNAEMERFTYTVSHDLKSPLVTIKTFLGFLREDMAAANAERIEKDLGFIASAVDKMTRMLGELLELSRVGRLVNEPVRVSFGAVVEEALAAVAGRIAKSRTQVHLSEQALDMCGERERLVEIWQNLLENSVKYMGEQAAPRIDIGAESVGRDTVFFVRDNGMGIDPRHKERVFRLFDKLDPNSEGSGLGLALVKRIVETYKGTIWLESDGAGKGACFRFTLPEAMQPQNRGLKA